MISFTVVLKKRKRKNFHTKNKKVNRKFFYFLPVILISVFSVCVAGLFEKEESENIFPKKDIQVFKETDDYSLYYNPVVINGFFDYRQGDKIDNETLVKLGVWSIICTEDTEKYEMYDGELTISEKEIEERVKLLFSDKTEFESTSSGKIVFDEKSHVYNIPTMGFSPEYSAVLKSVTAEKNKVRLVVDCLKNVSFKQDSLGNTVLPEAEKSIVITLKKDKNSFYIESVSEE